MSYGERQWSQLQGKLPVNKACTLQHQAVGVSKIKQNPFHLSSKFKISKRKKWKREEKGLVSGKNIDSLLTCTC
jgi:hypothetical protein